MIKNKKPNPECYNKAMKLLKLKPNECLAFEDNLIGATAAKGAGIDTCIIYDKNANTEREQLRKLTPYHINSFSDVLQ